MNTPPNHSHSPRNNRLTQLSLFSLNTGTTTAEWFPISLLTPAPIRRSPTMTRPLPPSTWPATVSVGQRRASPRFSASALISKWNPPSLAIYQPGCEHPSFIAQPRGSRRPQSRFAGQSRRQHTRYNGFLFHCSFPPFPDGGVSPPRDQPQFLLASVAPVDTRATVRGISTDSKMESTLPYQSTT
jgi:hypothetical protein